MTKRALKTGTLYRSLSIDKEAINQDSRTVEIAFSSEAPVDRWFGTEILDHDTSSVRLGRLSDGGPALVDHNTRDQIGVVEKVEIGSDRKGRAVVRFGKSARAEEIFNDVVDGIRRHVSVGYIVHRFLEDVKTETYRALDWEPYEVSFVSIPADTSVGVGRSAENGDVYESEVDQINQEPEKPAVKISIKENRMPEVDIEKIKLDGATETRGRILDMLALGEQYRHLGGEEIAHKMVREGKDLSALQTALLERSQTKFEPNAKMADVGLTDKETRQFSFMRAINALVDKDWKDAGFERECSEAMAQKTGKRAKGFYVPPEVMRRDLEVGTPTAGGNLVANQLLPGSFIELMRNKMSVMRAGAQMLTGLEGNILIPRQTGGATAYWVAESGAPTESQPAVDQVSMAPKTVGGYTDLSRKTLLQASIDVEQWVRQELATTVAIEADRVGMSGSGSTNQPRGVRNTSGIGAVIGGTNGALVIWDHIVDLESAVANANADIGKMAYITNTKVRGRLKKIAKFSGTNDRVWDGGANPLNDYQAIISNQVPSNLTKGSASGICSSITFGNWEDLIYGFWGAMDIMVDPYTFSTTGTVRVRILQDMDVATRHPASFASMEDALTA